MASTYGKRAVPPFESEYSRGFQRDWDRLLKSGRYDMGRLKETMLLIIANNGPLPVEYRDHELSGFYADNRECHVGGDFLLIYRVVMASKLWGRVFFVRTGTHAELF